MSYVILTLLMVVILFKFLNAFKHSGEGTRKIQIFAHEFGLVFKEGGPFEKPTLKGIFRGVSLNVYEELRYSSTQKHQKPYTLYRVHLSYIDVPAGLLLYSEEFSSKVGKLFGAQDIQLGVPDFDKAFIIRGESSDDVRNFLEHPDVQKCLLNIHKLDGNFRLEKGTLCLEFSDSIVNQHKIIQPIIEHLASCVQAMEQAGRKKISGNPSVPFAPSSLPKNSPPIPEEPQKMDNVNDSW